MATGASNADLAIVLVDARKGLLTQTHRHSIIASLLGIRHVVLAVNKIDLVGYDERTFRDIAIAYRDFAEPLGFRSLFAIPLSARFGDNVSSRSARTPWFEGAHLHGVSRGRRSRGRSPLRALPPAGAVGQPSAPRFSRRHRHGRRAAGSRGGESVVVAGSGRQTTVAGIFVADEATDRAEAGDAVTLTLAEELDIARGDVLSQTEDRPEVADQFTANVIWMSAEPMLPGRSYLMKIGTRTVPASVTELKHRLDVNNFDKLAAKRLDLNEVGFCNLATTMPVAYDPYADNRETGAFILIDRADQRDRRRRA